MTKITQLKVKSDMTFTAMAEINDELVDIYGDFDLKWKGQYPEIKDLWVTIWQPLDQQVHCEHLANDTDLSEQILATDDGTWYDEKMAEMMERSRDLMEDR